MSYTSSHRGTPSSSPSSHSSHSSHLSTPTRTTTTAGAIPIIMGSAQYQYQQPPGSRPSLTQTSSPISPYNSCTTFRGRATSSSYVSDEDLFGSDDAGMAYLREAPPPPRSAERWAMAMHMVAQPLLPPVEAEGRRRGSSGGKKGGRRKSSSSSSGSKR